MKDRSLKYLLGNRPLPGKSIKELEIYEDIQLCEQDVDDFLQSGVMNVYGAVSAIPKSAKSKKQSSNKKVASSPKFKKSHSSKSSQPVQKKQATKGSLGETTNESPRKGAKRKHESIAQTTKEVPGSTSNNKTTFSPNKKGKSKRTRFSSSNENNLKKSITPVGDTTQPTAINSSPLSPRRGPGRPRKVCEPTPKPLSTEVIQDLSNTVVLSKRKRGRPPKKKQQSSLVDTLPTTSHSLVAVVVDANKDTQVEEKAILAPIKKDVSLKEEDQHTSSANPVKNMTSTHSKVTSSSSTNNE